ncbi:MAG: PD40 domain-containing protein [Acidobacteria bacterium]|nr:PD40 domain-containing protein [Acidobacteriota bacterium]
MTTTTTFKRVSRIIGLFVLIPALALAAGQRAQNPEALLGAALHLEEVEADLEGAIAKYREVLNHSGADRATTGRALLQIGICYEKLGSPEASSAFERVIRDYADEPSYREIVEAAREALAELGAATLQDEPRELPEPGFTWSVAPDGSRGAFMAIDGKGMNVGVIDYETGEITWVTDLEWAKNNGSAGAPIWAPDSRRLAYSQGTPDGINEIRVVVPGETPEVIFRNERAVGVSDWLRDGSALVVSARQDDGSLALGLVSLRDGSFTQLRTTPWQGAFPDVGEKASLDGRFLLIQEDGRDGDVFLLATDGSEKVQLTDHPAADRDAFWSRDGNHVLFTSDRSGTNGLWALPVKDGRRAGTPFLVRAPWEGRFVGWAGDELAYATNVSIRNIYTVPIDPQSGEKTGEAQLIPYPDTGGSLEFPLWSADGREIAFLADASSASARVVIQPLDGGRAREYRIPEGVHYRMTALRWLPDGTGISFMARDRQRRPILVRAELAEGDWETTPLPKKTLNNGRAFEWSPTGDSFYYVQVSDDLLESSLLIEHHLATGAEEVLHTLEESIRRLALSPDGGELAFGSDREIWVLSRETGSVRRLAPERNAGSRSWSPDGWHLAIDCGQNYESSDDQKGICIVDVGTGNETKVELDPGEVLSKTMGTMLEVYAMRAFLLSPAGDRILFTIQATSAQVMIIADPLAAALEGQQSSSQRR